MNFKRDMTKCIDCELCFNCVTYEHALNICPVDAVRPK